MESAPLEKANVTVLLIFVFSGFLMAEVSGRRKSSGLRPTAQTARLEDGNSRRSVQPQVSITREHGED